MRTLTLSLALLLVASPALAQKKKKKPPAEPPKTEAPALDIPDLPPVPPAPELPELPELPAAPEKKPEYKVIDAHAASDPTVAAPAPAPPPPPPVMRPAGPGAGTMLAAGVALAAPSADLDISPAYFGEIAWAPEAGGGSWAVGLRAGYAIFKAEREVMVAGRGLDKNAFQASQLFPVSMFFRAEGTFESLAGAGLYPYIEAIGGLGVGSHDVHAFGASEGTLSVSPEVGATLGLDWRPGTMLSAMLFARMRSTSVSMDGHAAAAFLRSSLASTDFGLTLGIRL